MGWVVSATLRPIYPREREPVHVVWEAGWVPGPISKNSSGDYDVLCFGLAFKGDLPADGYYFSLNMLQ